MAIRENNPNDGKLHAARMRQKPGSLRKMGLSSKVTVSRRNKVKKGSGVMPAIDLQERRAIYGAAWKNENRPRAHSSGLSVFESQNQ